MALINWSDALSTGDDAIDADHQKLVSYMNELHAALSRGKGKDVLGPLLDKLVDYTRQHFSREEGMWAKAHYPQLDVHKRQHAELLAQVDDFKKKFDAGTMLLTLEVMTFLSNWLRRHIIGSDVVAARTCRGVA